MSESSKYNMFLLSQLSAVDTIVELIYVMRKNMFTMWVVAKDAEDVSINMLALKKTTIKVINYILSYCKNYNFRKIAKNSFRLLNDYYPTYVNRKVVDWLFVLNALNFSLWNLQDNKQWTVHKLTGYKALCFVIIRAMNEGKPIWNPNYYSKITRSEVEEIFRSDDDETHIALIDERVKVLHEIGKVLLDKYSGTFITCIEVCEGDPLKLWFLLFDDFESYRDQITYQGKTIYFGCKVRALLSDLAHFNLIYKGRMRNKLSTMFIDHCAPRALLHLGILQYSDRLKAKFLNDEPLENGSREDMEIRCCSFVAVRLLRSQILQVFKTFRSSDASELQSLSNFLPNIIDNFLWCYRRMMNELKSADKCRVQFHNIRSVYY